MKRTRDDTAPEGSAYAIQFEIMHGLTRDRSESYVSKAYAAHARLSSSNPDNADGVDLSVLYNNIALPWMPGPEQVLSALWCNEARNSSPPPAADEPTLLAGAVGPSFIRTVQLVANDSTTLIFANGGGTSSLRVPRSVGEHIFPGDVLLVTQAASATGGAAVAGDEDGEAASQVASVRLCSLDGSVFDDAEAWQDAVSSNVVAALRWVAALCAQPPGLPQLTFMEKSRLGNVPSSSSSSQHAGGLDGWTRVLQLPLLLRVSRTLRPLLNRAVMEKLDRALLSLLSTLLSVFKHTHSIMALPGLFRGLLHSLIASPLFLEGLSDVLIRSAAVLGSAAWQNTTECLATGVELAITWLCEQPAEKDIVSGPVCTATQDGARSALGSFETVLHRLSGVWVEYTRKLQEMQKHGQHQVPGSLYKEQRVYDMLEGLAAEHTFRPVTRWLQQREVAGQEGTDPTGAGGGSAVDVAASTLTPLDRIQQPPTLNHIEALVESSSSGGSGSGSPGGGGGGGGSILRAGVVEEQLAVMNRTYTPYLGKDAVRFIEAAAVAAHSELYGPASRAVCRILQANERTVAKGAQAREEATSSSSNIVSAGAKEDEDAGGAEGERRLPWREREDAEMARQRIRVLDVEQCGLRAGGFDQYSFAEIRHLAEYGLPVKLTVSLPVGPPSTAVGNEEDPGDEDGEAVSASPSAITAAADRLEERLRLRHGGSCFAFLLVRFLGKAAVFPVVATHVSAECGTDAVQGKHPEEEEPEDATAAPTTRVAVSVTAYVMKGADVLPQFVQTSAAIDVDGVPDAWLLTGSDPCDVEESSGGGKAHGPRHPRRRYGMRRGGALVAGGAVGDALSREPRPRLLPEGTPALTYVDLLTRLNRLRVELKEELSTGLERGMNGRVGGATAPPPASPTTAMGLWVRYFASGAAPTQSNIHSLSSSAISVVTGTGTTGKEVTSSLLREATDAAASLTPAQMEALHTLSSGSLATTAAAAASTATAPAGLQYLSNLRIVEGAVGSGKTSMLYASGLVKGKILAAARREHQGSISAKLKEASGRVRKWQSSVTEASSLADLLPDEGSNSSSGASSSNVLEGMAEAVEAQLHVFSRLSRGVQYCSTPLLLRCGRLGDCANRTGDIPGATRALLFHRTPQQQQQQQSNGETGGKDSDASSLGSITALVEASLARSCKAPLAAHLGSLLDTLRARGAGLSSLVAAGPEHSSLDAGLLSLILSAREVRDTAKACAAAAVAQSWPAYLSAHLWRAVEPRGGGGSREGDRLPFHPVVASRGAADSADGGHWATQQQLPSGRAAEATPVQMPASTRLTALEADQAAAWHAVFAQKQAEVLPLVLHQVHVSARRVFRLFLDLVLGVAATAQVSHFGLITCSDTELLHSLGLPLLWRWCPPHLLVDDFAGMQDGLLLALCPANTLTLSLSPEVPVYVERRLFRGPMSILRALRKDLQRTAALATTSLNEPLRCPKAEVSAALGQFCAGGGTTPFAGLLQPMLDSRDGDDDKASAWADGGSDEAASATPCFPSFSSFSSLELWTHAVPVTSATKADEAAAAFICETFRKYAVAKGSCSDAGAPKGGRRVHVYFPFATEACQFAELQAQQQHLDDSSPSPCTEVRAVVFPFSGSHQSPDDTQSTENDEECDVAVLCLSALVPVQPHLHGFTNEKALPGQPANEGRGALWKALLAATVGGADNGAESAGGNVGGARGGPSTSPVPAGAAAAITSAFLERLQWWLWCTMARARAGVLVICSKEFALHVPLFQYAEKYVVQLRRLLSPNKTLAYWLPRGTSCAVLAMNCPDHYRCRQTAAIAYTEETTTGHATESACEVVIRGAAACDSLCLKPFDHCTSRSHACLHPCHLTVMCGAEQRERDRAHEHCPYPCGKKLDCGHTCNRDCGTPCDPCTFVGLTELTCGQRVVCGMSSADKSVQYELVSHFQEARCGAPVQPCSVPVSVRCPRCGSKSTVPCFQLTSHESRELQAHRDVRRHQQQQQQLLNGGGDAGSASPADGDEETKGEEGPRVNISFILSDGECPGCVAVYNRVATKFGFDVLPEPTVVQRLCDEAPSSVVTAGEAGGDGGAEDDDANLCAMRERVTLPRHQLSAEAQAELRKAFAVAGKRSELLLMKEALEVSNGSAAENSDYVVYKRQYDAHRATQQRQVQERQDDIRLQMTTWAQRLRSEFTRQSELTSNLEAMMPSLLSEAQEEASRQRRYGY